LAQYSELAEVQIEAWQQASRQWTILTIYSPDGSYPHKETYIPYPVTELAITISPVSLEVKIE